MVYIMAMANTIQHRFNMTLDEAREVIVGGEGNAVEIVGVVLLGAIILRSTGHPHALEQWCCFHQNSVVNNDAAHTVVERLVPFFPATDAEVKSFTLFVK